MNYASGVASRLGRLLAPVLAGVIFLLGGLGTLAVDVAPLGAQQEPSVVPVALNEGWVYPGRYLVTFTTSPTPAEVRSTLGGLDPIVYYPASRVRFVVVFDDLDATSMAARQAGLSGLPGVARVEYDYLGRADEPVPEGLDPGSLSLDGTVHDPSYYRGVPSIANVRKAPSSKRARGAGRIDDPTSPFDGQSGRQSGPLLSRRYDRPGTFPPPARDESLVDGASPRKPPKWLGLGLVGAGLLLGLFLGIVHLVPGLASRHAP